MTTVNITIPDKTTPGYPRRQYQAVKFYEKYKKNEMTSEIYIEMLSFFATFLTDENERKKSAEDIMSSPIWELTEEQHEEILNSFIGKKVKDGKDGVSEEIPPPQKSAPLDGDSKEVPPLNTQPGQSA